MKTPTTSRRAFLQFAPAVVMATRTDDKQSIADGSGNTLSAADFGVVGDGSTNNLLTLARALGAASGKRLTLGSGVFVVDSPTPDFLLEDFTYIDGAGRGNTIIEFRNLANDSHGLTARNKTGIQIRNLTLMAPTALTRHQNAILFYDCNDCVLEFVEQRNFSAGFVFDSPVPPTTSIPEWGSRNKAINCISAGSHSYGFFSQAQNGTLWQGCEARGAIHQDGFKTGRGNRAHRIINCYSAGNNGDGFDTFDGFVDSVISGCISENNSAAGFQFKGTFGGKYTASDYVTRDAVISNCLARNNGVNGFLFQECRNLVVSNLLAVENIGFGFCFNNVQGLAVDNIHALRNSLDGVNIRGNSSRNRFSGIVVEDNSYTDGKVRNGIFHGLCVENGTANSFSAISAFLGTQPYKSGGQSYGIFTGASKGNTFSDYWCDSNTTGDVGGTNPYVNNVFGASLGTLKIRRGLGSPEHVVTGAIGDMYLRSDGESSACLYIKESGNGNTGWVAK